MLNKISLLRKPKISSENISQFQEEVDILWREVKALRREVSELKKKNTDLKEKQRTNSRNSSIPPSQDPHKKKVIKKTRSERKQGAQKGHCGRSRKFVPSSEVDQIENCLPPSRCLCEGKVEVQLDSYTRHQQYELPTIKPELTEYRLFTGVCAACGEKHQSALPPGTPTGMLGPQAMSTVASLTGDYRISRRETQRILKNYFGLSLSLGTISNIEKEVSEALKAPVEEAKQAVKEEDIVHADETSHKESGVKQWMWVAVTSFLSVFIIRPTRSKVVAKELLGEFFQGILVSDRFSSYNWVDTARRQFCWAHLIRDILKISQRSGMDQNIGINLLAHIKWMFLLWYKVRDKTFTRQSFQRAMKFTRSSIENLLREGTKSTHKKTRGTCEQILKKKEALWTFIDTEGVEPTNNIAERTLRAYVLWRKMSFGSQSERGNRFIERMMTSRASCRQQNRNVANFIKDALCSYYGKGVSPSLLPDKTSQKSKSA
jgi:transposase